MSNRPDEQAIVPARYWSRIDGGKIQCDLCPRGCRLQDGQLGACFVRKRQGDQLVLTTYGRSSGFCIDPIEKKPLSHFYPGSSVLSFGTAGCNLACKFCQNWDMSTSVEMDRLTDQASPDQIARAAKAHGCRSVAFTYNDPVIFLEYALDVAIACRAQGIKTVAVTAGYICEEPRVEFFSHIDAVNVDLKSFSDRFYQKLCGGRLAPVLETLEYLAAETSTWVEITTLLIPGQNDSDAELHELTNWVVEHLGPDAPIHFSAFHPDWKMRDLPSTPVATLTRARSIARSNGVRYAFSGNVLDPVGESTFCHHCDQLLIGRSAYRIEEWHLAPDGCCAKCGTRCAGHFAAKADSWSGRRQPVRIQDF